MRVAPEIVLTSEEHGELSKLVRSKLSSVRRVQRGRIVLLAADGIQNKAIAQQLGVGRVQVARWRERYAESRLVELTTQTKPEDIAGLYMSPPEHALVLCCDEKSQVQALDRTQPGLPQPFRRRFRGHQTGTGRKVVRGGRDALALSDKKRVDPLITILSFTFQNLAVIIGRKYP